MAAMMRVILCLRRVGSTMGGYSLGGDISSGAWGRRGFMIGHGGWVMVGVCRGCAAGNRKVFY